MRYKYTYVFIFQSPNLRKRADLAKAMTTLLLGPFWLQKKKKSERHRKASAVRVCVCLCACVYTRFIVLQTLREMFLAS